ncbi:MAG: branched-chain amino acid aminotransferase, partial [Geminicoccaceae bacterium]
RPAPTAAPVHSKAAGLYMICTLSKHAAEAKGFGDALMLDHEGYVAETTGANVFLVMGDTLHTPIPDRFLNGITRRTAIELAKARGFEVVERRIRPEEIAKADEMFVTGTAAEITPVRAVDDLTFKTGRVTAQLVDDFHELTRVAPASEAAA